MSKKNRCYQFKISATVEFVEIQKQTTMNLPCIKVKEKIVDTHELPKLTPSGSSEVKIIDTLFKNYFVSTQNNLLLSLVWP